MTYSEKLRDPRWQKMRLLVMDRDGFQCTNCGAEAKTLNVHHKVYRRGWDPWEYPDDELTTLCKDCHEELENKLTQLRLAVQEEGCMVSLDEVLGFIEGRRANALHGDKRGPIGTLAYSISSPEHFDGFLSGFVTAELVAGRHPVYRRMWSLAMRYNGLIPLAHFLSTAVKDLKPRKGGS